MFALSRFGHGPTPSTTPPITAPALPKNSSQPPEKWSHNNAEHLMQQECEKAVMRLEAQMAMIDDLIGRLGDPASMDLLRQWVLDAMNTVDFLIEHCGPKDARLSSKSSKTRDELIQKLRGIRGQLRFFQVLLVQANSSRPNRKIQDIVTLLGALGLLVDKGLGLLAPKH